MVFGKGQNIAYPYGFTEFTIYYPMLNADYIK
jgi:hypothetical protein